MINLQRTVFQNEGDVKKIPIEYSRICNCKPNNLNCLTAKEWLKSQIGVWKFTYESRDVRDKKVHPAAFPISLSKKVIELFTHEGELITDPFVGSGTSLIAAQDLNRNAIGFDLKREYINLCGSRLEGNEISEKSTRQIAIQEDANKINHYVNSRAKFTTHSRVMFTSHGRVDVYHQNKKTELINYDQGAPFFGIIGGNCHQ